MKTQRITSIDALRGFDMLWIIGADFLIKAIANLNHWSIFDFFAYHMDHAEWAGFRFYDNIFPLFLFLAGASLPFSLLRRKEDGQKMSKLYAHIIKRTVILIFLGFLVNGMLSSDWNGFSSVRYASVLGRIGLAWGIAAILVLHLNAKKIIYIFPSILVTYWAILMLIPVPGYGAGNMSLAGNLASYIDQNFLPGILYLKVLDPEGILSTIPAIATALLGFLTGTFLKKNETSKNQKALYMMLSGIAFLIFGYLWSFQFPVIKSLWTSSFVLMSGGLSLLLLSVFYFLIDVKGYHKWAFPFKVIGMNSIIIYLCVNGALNFYSTRDFFFKAILSTFSPDLQAIFGTILILGIEWIFLYILYKKQIFLKV